MINIDLLSKGQQLKEPQFHANPCRHCGLDPQSH